VRNELAQARSALQEIDSATYRWWRTLALRRAAWNGAVAAAAACLAANNWIAILCELVLYDGGARTRELLGAIDAFIAEYETLSRVWQDPSEGPLAHLTQAKLLLDRYPIQCPLPEDLKQDYDAAVEHWSDAKIRLDGIQQSALITRHLVCLEQRALCLIPGWLGTDCDIPTQCNEPASRLQRRDNEQEIYLRQLFEDHEAVAAAVDDLVEHIQDARTALALALQEVTTPPVIVRQPDGLLACVGDVVELSVEATGDIEPRYQWYKDVEPIENALEPTLQLVLDSDADAGEYTVSVWAGHEVSSAPAIIRVDSDPVVSGDIAFKRHAADFELSVTILGSHPTVFEWTRNGMELDEESNRIQLPLTRASAGEYRVIVSNECGSVSATRTITAEFLQTGQSDDDGEVGSAVRGTPACPAVALLLYASVGVLSIRARKMVPQQNLGRKRGHSGGKRGHH
jgi:hypothetical protein